MFDAVHLFARALHELSKAKDVTTQALSCSKDKKWTDGISLLNYMKTVNIYVYTQIQMLQIIINLF